MDIPADGTYKLCVIFTKLNGFLTLSSQFANIWYQEKFWKELEAPWKRDLQTQPFLLP